jgi:hypothetical protein
MLEQRKGIDRAMRFLGNVEFDYKFPFLRDLRAVANFGIDATKIGTERLLAKMQLLLTPLIKGQIPNTNYFLIQD